MLRQAWKAGQNCIVAVRQQHDEVVGIGTLCRSDALFIGGIQSALADIVHDCAGKQVDILQNNAQRAPQVGLSNLVDVDAVIADLAVRQIIEPVNQVGDSSLSGAGRTDEGDLLAGLGVERDVMQDLFIRRITEVHVIEHDAPGKLRVCDRAVAVRHHMSQAFRQVPVSAVPARFPSDPSRCHL